MSSSIQVVVRLRPLNDKEKIHGTLPVVSASTNEKTVTVIKGTGSKQARSSFSFDNVFTAFSTQEEVFEATLKPVIKDVMMGFESTVFAYGQTGTGKTHTMEGNLSNTDEYGVIPRSAEAIFQELKKPEYQSHSIKCSYLEIYNEDLCDLLTDCKKQTKLQIVEGKNGPVCKGLSEKIVSCAGDVLGLMQKAEHQRKVGETNMNKQSSRSHCIFTIRVDAKRRLPDGSIFECRGKLHMVDLAGSECAKTANLGGSEQAARERERMNINRSLLTLGRVVSMLKEQSKKKTGSVRIPYRDSKLTRILQESLGGRCKTCIIATLSPSVLAIEESTSTLNYAQAANGIVNKPVSTSFMSQVSSMSSSVSEKSSPEGAVSVEHWQEMELRLEYMKVQVDEAKAALARKHLQQQELVEQAEKSEASRLEMEQQYLEASRELGSLKDQLSKEVAQKEAAEENLRQTELTLKKTTVMLCATQKTEISLTAEARALIDAVKNSVADGDDMHRMIRENRQTDVDRRQATQKFNSAAVALLEGVVASLANLSAQEEEHRARTSKFAEDGAEQQIEFAEQALNTIRNASERVASTVCAFKSCMTGENGILPSLEETSSQVTNGVANANNVVADGERNLMEKWDSCKVKLSAFGNKLNELEAAQSDSSQKALVELDQNISATNRKLSDLVSSATKALDGAREERKKARDAVNDVMQQWKLSTVDSGRKIEDQSHTQQNAVNEMLQMVNSEMKRYDNMETQLSKQKSLLETTGVSHAKDLQSQGEVLVSHKDALRASQQRQKDLSLRFVENVMSGVEELVQKQMAAIMKAQDENYEEMVATNDGFIERNVGASNHAIDILQAVESTNGSLLKEVEVVRSNENAVAALLKDTGSVLAEIKNASVDQRASIENFSDESSKGMQQIHSLEVSAERIVEAINSDGEQCTNQLTKGVLQGAKDSISALTAAGRDTIAFCRDEALATMASSINDMEKPRSDVMARFDQECDRIRTHVAKGGADINKAASELSKLAEEMEDGVLSAEKDFNNVADDLKSSISEYKENLSESAAKHNEATSLAISDSVARTTDAKTRVSSFVTNVIRAEEEIEPARDRKIVKYNDRLTATPSEIDILQNMKGNESETTENYPLNDESVEVNTSTESEESEMISQPAVLRIRSPSRDNISSSRPNKKKSTITKQKGSKSETKRSVQKGSTPIKTKRARR